ncbi:type II toxin-antitoxin system Phd/YefM family antitoxin [Patescibacteria group bacterium]
MNTSTLSASDARANIYDMLDDVQKHLKRFTITHKGKPAAVVMSISEVESLEETAEILAIPGARESIKKGMEEAKQGKLIKFNPKNYSL